MLVTTDRPKADSHLRPGYAASYNENAFFTLYYCVTPQTPTSDIQV